MSLFWGPGKKGVFCNENRHRNCTGMRWKTLFKAGTCLGVARTGMMDWTLPPFDCHHGKGVMRRRCCQASLQSRLGIWQKYLPVPTQRRNTSDCWSAVLHMLAHTVLASCNLGSVPYLWGPQNWEDEIIMQRAASFTKKWVQSGWCKQSLQPDCGTLFLPQEYLRVSRIVLCWNSVLSSDELYTVCTSTSFEHLAVNVCISASECEVISLERKYY